LNKNGWIVLEFYETNQAAIPELNKKRPIYLQSENEKVPLVPVEVLQGEFRVTQVILKPGTSLKVNETYVLHIDSLSQQEGTVDNDRWNSVTNIYEPFEFQIFNKVDSLKPEMKGIPKEMDFRYKKFGCGLAAYVDFKLAGIDHSDFFTRVIVRNKATGKTTDYLVALKNGVVSVGHGMCGGPFRGIGNNCEVRFELMTNREMLQNLPPGLRLKIGKL